MGLLNKLNSFFSNLITRVFSTDWASVIIIMTFLLVFILGKLIGAFFQKRKNKKLINNERRDAIKRSRAVLGGQFTEQLAPYLPNFPAEPTEVRFIGKPIDYIAFSGASEGKISEVVFIEVKSGSSTLTTVERELKKAISEKRVRYVEYHFLPEKI